MKFKVGDWIIIHYSQDWIEKIIEIDEINQRYKYYCYINKKVCSSDTVWFDTARLLTQEEKAELL